MGKVRSITVNFNAGTAKFVGDVDRAGAKIKAFGQHTVSSMQASSASIRLVEGNFTNNVRAVERFLGTTLKLGPVLQAAFPLVGGIAFLGLMGEIGTKAYDFFKDMRDASEKMRGAWAGANTGLRLTNDELRIANDRLENDIAKLEGRHQNTLKLALDEVTASANRLEEALLRDLEKVDRLLLEGQNGLWARAFGGSDVLRQVRISIAGETGTGGNFGAAQDIIEAANQRIGELTAAAQAKGNTPAAMKEATSQAMAIRTRAIADANAELAKALAKVNDALGKQQDLQHAMETGFSKDGSAFVGYLNPGLLQKDIDSLKQAQGALQESQRAIPLRVRNADLGAEDAAKAAARANAAQERPLDRMIDELKAKVAEAGVRLKAAGLDETSKAIAKAEGEAIASIERANEALKRQGEHLLSKDPTQSEKGREALRLATTEQTLTLEASLRDKVREVIDSTRDQIETQKMLNAAIGKGWEAQKAAATEVELMKQFGATKYETALHDPMSDEFAAVSAARPLVAAGVQDKHDTQADERVRNLQNEIALQNVMTQAQALGAAAVEQAAFAEDLRQRKMSAAGLTAQEEQAAWLKFYAERGNKAAAEVAKIDQEIAATKRLIAAEGEGAEAVRKAALENKYAAMARTGSTPAAINAERKKDQLLRQQELTAEVMKTALAYKNAIESIDLQLAALDQEEAVQGKTLALEVARRNLEDERLEQLARESLAMRGLQDGVRAFFLQMQKSAESAAEILDKALNSSVDRFSELAAKMLTQKAPKGGWGQEFGKQFKTIGTGMVESSIKSAAQFGLGKLGAHLGKPDFTSANPGWVRIWGGQSGNKSDGGGMQNAPGSANTGIGDWGGEVTDALNAGANSRNLLGGIEKTGISFGSKMLQKFLGRNFSTGNDGTSEAAGPGAAPDDDWGGFMAEGGYTSPNKAYIAGEKGPELIAGISARVYSHGETARMFGGGSTVINNNIDARNADLGVANRLRRTMEALHSSAVASAVQAMHERSRRVPGGGR